MGMEDCQSLDERTGWGFMWTSSEWRRQFLVLSPGAFKAFSCNQRSSVEKMISLARCVVGFHKPFASPESKTSKYPPKKRIWKNLSKLVLSDHAFSQADIAVITVKPRRGKTCFLMFPSQAEAEVWKFGIEEAVALANADVEKKDLKKSSRRSKAVQQASDAIDQTRMFFQTKSLLKPPFGLRWEAYSPLFRVQEARQTPSSSTHTMEREKVEPISSKPTEPLWHDLATLQGCTAFLCSSYLNVRALEHATLMVDHFKGSYQMGDSSLPDELRLEAWKGTAHRIVKALVDGVLLSNPSLEPCLANDELMDQLWSASEVWVFGAVHDKIMGACKQMFAMQDVSTNNILAKLEKVDPAKLGVRAEFEVLVLGEAMDEFRLLNHLRTPYEKDARLIQSDLHALPALQLVRMSSAEFSLADGKNSSSCILLIPARHLLPTILGGSCASFPATKAMCLRKTVMCIIDGIQRLIKSCTGALKDTEGLLPCTDDLLSFMLLLMARAKVRNLHANACYMENFINLQKDTSRGELVYHITNFVAACKYLHSEAVQELLANVSLLPKTAVSQMQVVSGDSRSSSPSFCRRSSSFEGSSGTHITASSSRVDSLESEANVTRWEEICDKSSCFDPDAFSNWRGSDSLNGRHFSEFESMKNPFSPNRDWYIDREDSLGDDRPNSFRSGCGKRVLALPGDSPGFLLAPTYH